MRTRPAAVLAPLPAGLLAGAMFYGWANVAPTMDVVPLDVRLIFHTTLMTRNGIVMQALMAVSFLAAVWLAVVAPGRARGWAFGAIALVGATFVVTRFGNVPINDEIRAWLADGPAADYLERLQVWGVLNDIRTATAVGAFAVLLVAADLARRTVAAVPVAPGRDPVGRP